jgi:hypothetical protein
MALQVFFYCNATGASTLSIQSINSYANISVYNQTVVTYQLNSNFVSYGTSNETFLPATSNTSFCSDNVPLNFTYKYFNISYTTVPVCVQPYIALNNTAAAVINAVYQKPNLVSTNNWGTVSYRYISDSASLSNLSQTALLSYSYSGLFNFTATNGFVVTWNHVPFVVNQSGEVNAQIVLLTDGYFSFFLVYYGSISEYLASAYSVTGLTIPFIGGVSSSNVGTNGVYAMAVNNYCKK